MVGFVALEGRRIFETRATWRYSSVGIIEIN
jgi:hypothetical protein